MSAQFFELLDNLDACVFTGEALIVDEQRAALKDFVGRWTRALAAAEAQPVQEPRPTAGMNIAQRILHVGGRDNAAGYVEFGSTQAVEALVRQVLRDLPQPVPLTDEQIWQNNEIMACNASIGMLMLQLIRLVRAVERVHGIGVKP